MSFSLRVRWTVTPSAAPQPIRSCSTCKCLRPHRSSDRFRLNANGKLLDAWLIYKCVHCETTWNLPVFERRRVRGLDPEMLHALRSNDPALARRLASDDVLIRRYCRDVFQPEGLAVQRQSTGQLPAGWTRLEILIAAALPVSVRLDRLLATELDLSRARLQRLVRARLVEVAGSGLRALRRPVRHGLRVELELGGETDRDLIADAAMAGREKK